MARSGQKAVHHQTNVEHANILSTMIEEGSASVGRDNEALNFGIQKGGSASTTSSSKGITCRDLIPITPEILHYLDRMETDKNKHARYLTEHLKGQRTLPSTEQELQLLLEKRASR